MRLNTSKEDINTWNNEVIKKEIRFQRIANHRNTLMKIDQSDPSFYASLMEMDCIDHFFGADGIDNYQEIATFCKKSNINRVVDIGCAYGFQSEIFLQKDLQYVGVEVTPLPFWNKEHFEYVSDKYPCNLSIQKGDLAVSILCLTWNCYLYDEERTLIEQCEALKLDFEHCILNTNPPLMRHYFKKSEKIGKSLYYFSNKR